MYDILTIGCQRNCCIQENPQRKKVTGITTNNTSIITVNYKYECTPISK